MITARGIIGGAARILATAIIVLPGCSSDNTGAIVAAKNSTNIKRVRNLYAAYMETNGKGPSDEAQLKDFITKKMPAETLKLMTVDPAKVDELFISERDGKPFKLKPGLHWGGPGSPNPAVIFESEGIGDIRQVAFAFGNVEEVDAAKYKLLWEDSGS